MDLIWFTCKMYPIWQSGSKIIILCMAFYTWLSKKRIKNKGKLYLVTCFLMYSSRVVSAGHAQGPWVFANFWSYKQNQDFVALPQFPGISPPQTTNRQMAILSRDPNFQVQNTIWKVMIFGYQIQTTI